MQYNKCHQQTSYANWNETCQNMHTCNYHQSMSIHSLIVSRNARPNTFRSFVAFCAAGILTKFMSGCLNGMPQMRNISLSMQMSTKIYSFRKLQRKFTSENDLFVSISSNRWIKWNIWTIISIFSSKFLIKRKTITRVNSAELDADSSSLLRSWFICMILSIWQNIRRRLPNEFDSQLYKNKSLGRIGKWNRKSKIWSDC